MDNVSLDIPSHRDDKPAGRIRQKNEQIILRAAEAEFAASGFKGATMNRIAERAGLPKSNIHYYFKSKQQLYAEVLAVIIELWDSALNELDAEAEPAAVLPGYIRAKMQLAWEYPAASRVFAKEILSGAPRLQTYFHEGYSAWFARKEAVFQAWIDAGRMQPLAPAHVIFLIWSATQQYADYAVQMAAALGKPALTATDIELATATVTDIIVRGIGARLPDS